MEEWEAWEEWVTCIRVWSVVGIVILSFNSRENALCTPNDCPRLGTASTRCSFMSQDSTELLQVFALWQQVAVDFCRVV